MHVAHTVIVLREWTIKGFELQRLGNFRLHLEPSLKTWVKPLLKQWDTTNSGSGSDAARSASWVKTCLNCKHKWKEDSSDEECRISWGLLMVLLSSKFLLDFAQKLQTRTMCLKSNKSLKWIVIGGKVLALRVASSGLMPTSTLDKIKLCPSLVCYAAHRCSLL